MKILALVLSMLAVLVLSLPRPQGEAEGDEHFDGPWPIIPYEMAFEISDEESRTYYSRTEMKLPNGDVIGSWAVLLPNDDIQSVVYNVTGGKGYRTSIVYTPADEISTL